MRKAILAAVLLMVCAGAAAAAPIVVSLVPDKTYQNTANDPCVFYGPAGDCPKDPIDLGWLSPAGPTNSDVYPDLVQTYEGSYLEAFRSIVGASFVLGYDVNDANKAQTLRFEIFFDTGAGYLSAYQLTPFAYANSANGTGFADYVMSVGCTQTDVNGRCVSFTPFVIPSNAVGMQMTFGFALDDAGKPTGNDGPDKVFAIRGATTVPDGGSVVMLLGAALMGLAGFRRFVK